ncbi:MAG: hypothetical protein EP330_09205 [Deltaproteobacteria bacterium]|nr:MAG: hypothetical protein EP330_09205 [Deltaproteobacteria bacterium]
MRAASLAVPLLIGCQADPSPTCMSMSGDAVEQDIEVAVMAFGFYAGETPTASGPGEVIQTDAGWRTATERWQNGGGLDPDFPNEVVFVNRWDSGCGGLETVYAGWVEDDRLRLVIDEREVGDLCGTVEPQIDLIVVPTQGATDIAWCAPG